MKRTLQKNGTGIAGFLRGTILATLCSLAIGSAIAQTSDGNYTVYVPDSERPRWRRCYKTKNRQTAKKKGMPPAQAE